MTLTTEAIFLFRRKVFESFVNDHVDMIDGMLGLDGIVGEVNVGEIRPAEISSLPKAQAIGLAQPGGHEGHQQCHRGMDLVSAMGQIRMKPLTSQ